MPESLHSGVTLDGVGQLTGFAFRVPADLPASPLTQETRRLLYGPVKEKLTLVYPHFATRLQAA